MAQTSGDGIPIVDWQERTELLDRSLAMISRIARAIVRRNPGQVASDFVNEAPSMIWEAMQNTEAICPKRYPGFCAQVLTRKFIDRGRRLLTRPAHRSLSRTVDGLDSPDWDLPCRQLQAWSQRMAMLDRQTIFSPADLIRVRKWAPVVTIELLGVFELWTKLSSSDWNRCLHSAEANHPFPVDQLSVGTNFAKNVDVIAAGLNKKPSAVRKSIYRNRLKLLTLDCIREVISSE